MFEDKCRVGEKGRTGHRWWIPGERPRGLRQLGYEWAFLFGAVPPPPPEGFALVLPQVSTAAIAAFLERFAATRGPDVHIVLVFDQAGWHASASLAVPSNLTLVPLRGVERPDLRAPPLSHSILLDHESHVIGTAVFLILDQLSVHRSAQVRAWLAEIRPTSRSSTYPCTAPSSTRARA